MRNSSFPASRLDLTAEQRMASISTRELTLADLFDQFGPIPMARIRTCPKPGCATQQDVIEVARALTGWGVNPARQGGDGFVFRAQAHDAGPKVVLGHQLRAGRGIEGGEGVLDIVSRSSRGRRRSRSPTRPSCSARRIAPR